MTSGYIYQQELGLNPKKYGPFGHQKKRLVFLQNTKRFNHQALT